jgi:Arc/MetJ-type ribon-helix-helix transcriptional regulator
MTDTQTRYRQKGDKPRVSRTFRLSASDDAVIQRMVDDGLYVNPSEVCETAIKRFIDQMAIRYPHLAPIEADDAA